MKLVKSGLVIATLLVVGLMVMSTMTVGCGPSEPPPPEEQVLCEYNLIAGNFAYDAGTVIIQEMENDGRHEIWVTYQTDEPWYLDETHVHLAWYDTANGDGHEWDDYVWGDAVGNKGNPKPGKFDYSTDHGSGVNEFTYKIDIGEWDDTLLETWEVAIAAHAVVYKWMGFCYKEETAWGEGMKFPKSWAMFMLFPCKKEPTFPDLVQFTGVHGGLTYSYWEFTFYNVPDDLYLKNGQYDGWCRDKVVYMSPNTLYYAELMSSMDDDAPDLAHGNWNMINWLINHKYDYIGDGYNRMQYQYVMWYFVQGITPGPTDPIWDIIDAAVENGEHFWPTTNQYMAIIMTNYKLNADGSKDYNIQDTFFELDP